LSDPTLLESVAAEVANRRPGRLAINAVLTLAPVMGVMPLPVLFMIGFAISLLINCPTIDEQKTLLNAHSGSALAVAGMIFAAGIFTCILSGTKMIDAMADGEMHLVPPALGSYLSVVTALLSIPFTVFISNGAF